MKHSLIAGALLLVGLLSPRTFACSIPVFRYALERWTPAPYELLVFHRGALSAEHQAILKLIPPVEGETNANVSVRTVDLDASPGGELVDYWKQQKLDALPAMVLRNGPGSEVHGAVWTGPFNAATVDRLLRSPARAKIVERVLKGDSAVWVLLESGNKAADDAAEELLSKKVAQLQKTLKLSEIDPDDVVKHKISVSAEELKVAFSVVRVSQNDPAEEVLVRMLLTSEDDLAASNEPMAFPVFGRGRALFALVGSGISSDTISEACSFVIGPCSCVVKELNPGHDILLTAGWGAVAKADHVQLEEELAHLQAKPGTLVPIAPGTVTAGVATPPPAAAVTVSRGSVKWGFVLIVGLGVVLGMVGAVFLLRKH